MFKKIFESGKIGNLEIKSRLIVPPMLSERIFYIKNTCFLHQNR